MIYKRNIFQEFTNWFITEKTGKANSLNTITRSNSDSNVVSFVSLYNQVIQGQIPLPQTEKLIEKIEINPNYKPPKYPIVLCHGLSGFDTLLLIPSISTLTNLLSNAIKSNNSDNFLLADDKLNEIQKNVVELEYWIGVKEILESRGCTLFITRVPPFGSIEERATKLHSALTKISNDISKTKDQNDSMVKFNFIAHSMGGLDCRYLISRIPESEKNYKIASLTTLSTPHNGSEVADFLVRQFENVRKSLNDNGPLLPMCYYQLTTYYAHYFNNITTNDPNVKYFSYGSYFTPKWYNSFSLSWNIINTRTNGEKNDGMVTVKSSHWGKYMGTLPNVDHLDIINWRNSFQDKFDSFIDIYTKGSDDNSAHQKPNPIDILQFYVSIIDNLVQEGC